MARFRVQTATRAQNNSSLLLIQKMGEKREVIFLNRSFKSGYFFSIIGLSEKDEYFNGLDISFRNKVQNGKSGSFLHQANSFTL
ncbi:MAG: hypothetical protein RIC03_10050 [Cyclobacteriaceae bacterium]